MQDVSPAESTDLALLPSDPHEVVPGVWRVPLPVPFGVHAINAYLLRGDGRGGGLDAGWCLVDAPLGTRRAEEALLAGFRAAGASPGDLRAIVLTHGHPDHVGAVGRWQRQTGAPVYLLGLECQMIARLWADPANAAMLGAARDLMCHGMPPEEAQRLATQAAQLRGAIEPPERPTILAHGQRIHLAGGRYQVFWTPGHADGHLCLLRDDGVFLAGDHVLPGVVPTVGWYPWSRPDPLADHEQSLRLVAGLPVTLVLPGHGQPFADLSRRVDELLGIHARRTVELARVLAARPDGASAYILSERMFPTRWHAWPESRRLAVAETVAYLEHLRGLDRVERVTAADDTITYRRAAEDSTRASA